MEKHYVLFKTYNETDIKTLVGFLAPLFAGGIRCYLSGNLGAGKTTFCKRLIKHYTGSATIVTSPTYNIVKEYNVGSLTIFHVDLYRINADADYLNLDVAAWFKHSAITLIEWPEIGATFLPSPDITIHIFVKSTVHTYVLQGVTQRGNGILMKFYDNNI